MSCLVFSEIYPPKIGGSGQWLHELYSRLPHEDLVLLVGKHDQAEEFDSKLKLQITRADLSGNSWTLMTQSGRSYLRRLYRHVAALHKQHHFTEIHCARVIPEGVAAWFASVFLRINLVCFVHGEDIELAYESRETRWLVQRVFSQSKRIICNSQNTKRMLIESWKCGEHKIMVLNPGIDSSHFKPTTEHSALRTELGWNDREVLLTVSRLEIRKGHDKMLEALPELIKHIPNLLYVIVGSGEERQNLESYVSEHGLEQYVEFKGACDNDTMLSCIQACDVFVLPNRRVGSSVEGFGIVLLEAQACGKPVIAGKSGGTAETMVPYETGLIIDCTKSENLVAPLIKLFSNDEYRERMGNAARSLMVSHFDWTVISEKANKAVFTHSNSGSELQQLSPP